MHKTCGLSGKQKPDKTAEPGAWKCFSRGFLCPGACICFPRGISLLGPFSWQLPHHPFPLFSAMSSVMPPPPSCSPGSAMQDYFQGECLYAGPVHEKWVICVVSESCSADSGHIFVFVFVAPFWKNPEQIFKGVLLRLELLIHLQIAVLWGCLVEGGRTALPHHPCLRDATWEAAGCSCSSSCKLSI